MTPAIAWQTLLFAAGMGVGALLAAPPGGVAGARQPHPNDNYSMILLDRTAQDN